MTLIRQFATYALVACTSLFLVACQPGSATAPGQASLAQLSVAPASLTLAKGSSHPLVVNGLYSDAKTYDLTSGATFMTSNSSVATVSGSGLVTAVGPGTATITATHTASSKTASSVITVPSGPVVSIAVSPLTATLQVGGTQQLSVTGTHDDGTTSTITTTAIFTSSDPTVATVSATGLVTAVAGGTTLVGVVDSASGRNAAAAITVSSGPSYTILDFNTAGLVYKLTPFGNAESAALTSSGVPPGGPLDTVVQITKGVGADCWAGTTLSVGGKASIAQLPFSASATKITVQMYVPIANLDIKLKVEDANNGGVSVETDVVPTQVGWQTITFDFSKPSAGAGINFAATYNKISIFSDFSCGIGPDPAANETFFVGPIVFLGAAAPAAPALPPPALSSVGISPSPITLTAGAAQQLTVTGTYSDSSTATLTSGLTFGSDANGVALVSGSGLVTAVSAGTAHVTATDTASGLNSSVTVTVNAAAPAGNGLVFVNGFDTDVGFVTFGGATNTPVPAADPSTTMPNGHVSLKAVLPSSNYGGGALVAATPRNLSSFNAVTFWAKGSTSNATLKVGMGNNALAGPYNVESIGIALTTTWTQYMIPLPDPVKMTAADGLFHYADGPNNYTVWFGDIQYVSLPSNQVGPAQSANAGWPTLTVPVTTTATINPAPNAIHYTVPALPNGGNLTDVAWRWFTLTSSNPSVATVDRDGVVTGVAAGSATITATMNGLVVAGSSPVTVTTPLATPSTIAATPGLSPANVISLFSSAYSNIGVDTWRTGWSSCCNEIVEPYTISGHDVKQYTLHSFVGIEFGLNGTNAAVDAAGNGMTFFHVDLWSPNPASALEIQLVNDAGPAAAIGRYAAGQIATGSWVSLDIPLASFGGLTATNKINQLLFVPSANSVLYVDNVYFHK
jgi:uncharacterized protein YjdB